MKTQITSVDVKLTKEVESLRTQVEQSEACIDRKIENKLSNSADQNIREMEERERRKTSIMVFKMIESDSTKPSGPADPQ